MWYLVLNYDNGRAQKKRAPNARTALEEVFKEQGRRFLEDDDDDVVVYTLAEDDTGTPETHHIDEFAVSFED